MNDAHIAGVNKAMASNVDKESMSTEEVSADDPAGNIGGYERVGERLVLETEADSGGAK